jgi:hypothetical protein
MGLLGVVIPTARNCDSLGIPKSMKLWLDAGFWEERHW